MGLVWTYVIFWAGVGAAVGYYLGANKGRSSEGLMWGLLLGWVGWIIVALLPPAPSHHEAGTRKCPDCAEYIRSEAVVCKHCGRDLSGPAALPPTGPEVLEFARMLVSLDTPEGEAIADLRAMIGEHRSVLLSATTECRRRMTTLSRRRDQPVLHLLEAADAAR